MAVPSGDEFALRAGGETMGEGERERLVRKRRDKETRDELLSLERLGTVSSQFSVQL